MGHRQKPLRPKNIKTFVFYIFPNLKFLFCIFSRYLFPLKRKRKKKGEDALNRKTWFACTHNMAVGTKSMGKKQSRK